LIAVVCEQVDYAGNQRCIARIDRDIPDKRPIDFERRNRELADRTECGKAGSKIVGNFSTTTGSA